MYQLHIRWQSGGSPVDETRQFRVRAGDQISINLLRPNGAASIRYVPGPGAIECQSFYCAPGQAVPNGTGTPAYSIPTYTVPSYYFDSSPSYSTPLENRTRFYNEDDYPRPGGPPGGWGAAPWRDNDQLDRIAKHMESEAK